MLRRIGKYEIEEELGRGACGQVFRAFDPKVGRPVAIKVLLAGDDDQMLARFQREAAAAGKLRHENIVTIYEFGEHKGNPFIAMEYLEGEDLEHALARGAPMTLLEKMRIMSQIAEGLHCAHRAGVIHRDVKPANIMLLADGTVKVTDFGIAHVAGPNATRLTQRGDLIGTILYMSPEQLRSDIVDALCDIFAYGVIYYELLTGAHPFGGSDAAQVMRRISKENPAPVRSLAAECPEALEQIVHRALEKQRDLRYQSLEDLQLDARPILLDLERERAAGLLGEARRLFAGGDLDRAQAAVREILDLDAANREARELREKIQRELRRRKVQAPVEELVRKAEEDLAGRRFAKAITSLEAALQLDPDNADLRTRLEQARESRERHRRLATLVADARAQLAANRLTAAFQHAAAAREIDPRDEEAAELHETIRRQLEAREQERRQRAEASRAAMASAARWIARGQPDRAVAALREIAAQYPDDTELAAALAQARQAEQEQGKYLRERMERAAQLEAGGEWEAALAVLNEAAARFASAPELASAVKRLQGLVQKEERRKSLLRARERIEQSLSARSWSAAQVLIEEARREFGQDPEWRRYLDLAETRRQEGRRRDLIERIEQRIAGGELEEAQKILKQALRSYPTEIQLVRLQRDWEREFGSRESLKAARTLFEQRRFADAEAAVRRSLVIKPTNNPGAEALLQAIQLERAIDEEKRRPGPGPTWF